MKRLTTILAVGGMAMTGVPAAASASASPAKIETRSSAVRPSTRIESEPRVGRVSVDRIAPAPASEVHPWRDGAVYHLATAPERVSDIVLQSGEALIAVAAGDTARWVIGDTTSGSGPARQTHILVKPSAPGLRTNLMIATDRRVYHLELASGPRATTSLAWTYPWDELLALQNRNAAIAAAGPAASVAIERLNFNYAISGDTPPWRPIRAFDDGSQVFIQFPAGIGSTEAPPLFVIGSSDRAELVNYRKRGRYYVVDRLFGAAELRIGGKRQQVVRITRTDRERPREHRRTS